MVIKKLMEYRDVDGNIYDEDKESAAESDPPIKIRVVHWNMLNMKSAIWDSTTIQCLAEAMKIDLILLSNVGTFTHPTWLNYRSIFLPYFDPEKNGLFILCREETVGPFVSPVNGYSHENFHFLAMDLKLKDGIHRIVLTHSASEEDSISALDEISYILTPTDRDDVNFVHLLGTLKSSQFTLQSHLPGEFSSLLDVEWETNGEKHDDLALSKEVKKKGKKKKWSETLNVKGHKPFWPYQIVFWFTEWDNKKDTQEMRELAKRIPFEPPKIRTNPLVYYGGYPSDFHRAILVDIGEKANETKKMYCNGDWSCEEKLCDQDEEEYRKYCIETDEGHKEKKFQDAISFLSEEPG